MIVQMKEYVSGPIQRQILRILDDAATAAYQPELRSGRKMKIRMNCFGWHWNPKTYKYEKRRSDFDGAEVPAIPTELQGFAQKIAVESGAVMEECLRPFDIMIANSYEEGSSLGLHRDNSESEESMASGYPIVSISVGQTARFYIGKTTKAADLQRFELASGDALVFGGENRLDYHGVTSILKSPPPPVWMGAKMRHGVRVNLTFRIL